MNEHVLEFSLKQLEFIRNATHRWNGKIGATQCGKTYIDVTHVIPDRILERRGKAGLNLILGVSKGTIERNVLEPMRDFWGEDLVGRINSENIAVLFGEKVYCLGAEKVSQVAKLRGAKFKYAYCDELVEYNEEVFALLKSRLSLAYSVCDFTGNPSHPTHWLKSFIDSDVDIYNQSWTIYDNPFLPQAYVRALEREYKGTVYYDRYILGLWKRAEGVIYHAFANNPNQFILHEAPILHHVSIGIDFGGNGSATTFVATGFSPNMKSMSVLASKRIKRELTPVELDDEFVKWCQYVLSKYQVGAIKARADNAEPILLRGLKQAVQRAGLPVQVLPALKKPIKTRINALVKMMGMGRFAVMDEAQTVIDAIPSCIWDDKHPDERLDDGKTADIDTMDALEYSFEEHINILVALDWYGGA